MWTLNENSGIYQIKCKINDNIYIGSSKNLKERKRMHFVNLKNGHHCNTHLQNAWNKYGKENFIFEVLLTCHPDMLLWYEQQFLDQWKPEYNKAKNALSPMKGRKHSKETKIKMRNVHINKSDYPEFHKTWKNPYFKGKSMPEDVRNKISNSLLGRKHSEETLNKFKKRFNEKPNRAIIHSGFISPDNIRYENIFNLAKFCREHDLDRRRFHELKSNKRSNYKGWVLITEVV